MCNSTPPMCGRKKSDTKQMESFFSGVWRCRDDDDDGMDDRKKETEREEGFYARADIIKNFFFSLE